MSDSAYSTMASAQKYGVPPGAGAAQGGFGSPAPMAAAPPQGYVTPYQPAIQQLGGIQPVVGQQPGMQQIQWMPAPQAVAGCPPGLEYLTQIDQLLVHQQIELFEVLTDIETVNRYQVKNSLGQQVYFAHEESEFCERQCCGARRGFQMHITDNHNQEVLRLSREFKCCGGCCWCANLDCVALDIAVEAPIGNVIGYVRQAQSWLYPNFTVLNPAKESVLTIGGPFCFCQNVCCTEDIDFLIMDENKTTELGKLCKQWGGIFKEAYTNADNFTLTFPTDLSVEMKACLLGSVFLIDFMFFEHPKNNNQH